MAARNSKGSTRKARRTSKPTPTQPPAAAANSTTAGLHEIGGRTYTDAGLIEIGRRFVQQIHTPREPSAYEIRKRREEKYGITLKGERLETARHFVSDINMAAVATYRLAIDAGQHNELEAQWYRVAIENIAKVVCRKADVLASILDDIGFGNFDKEFTAPAEAK